MLKYKCICKTYMLPYIVINWGPLGPLDNASPVKRGKWVRKFVMCVIRCYLLCLKKTNKSMIQVQAGGDWAERDFCIKWRFRDLRGRLDNNIIVAFRDVFEQFWDTELDKYIKHHSGEEGFTPNVTPDIVAAMMIATRDSWIHICGFP